MEAAFKTVFVLAILVFCVLVVGVFLLIIKILFLVTPEVTLMGILMTPAP